MINFRTDVAKCFVPVVKEGLDRIKRQRLVLSQIRLNVMILDDEKRIGENDDDRENSARRI